MTESLEYYMKKMPHYCEEFFGVKVIFFCSKGCRKLFVAEIKDNWGDEDLRVFYEKLGQHPEVEEIEHSHYSTQPALLCNSSRWRVGHARCEGCEKKKGGE